MPPAKSHVLRSVKSPLKTLRTWSGNEETSVARSSRIAAAIRNTIPRRRWGFMMDSGQVCWAVATSWRRRAVRAGRARRLRSGSLRLRTSHPGGRGACRPSGGSLALSSPSSHRAFGRPCCRAAVPTPKKTTRGSWPLLDSFQKKGPERGSGTEDGAPHGVPDQQQRDGADHRDEEAPHVEAGRAGGAQGAEQPAADDGADDTQKDVH